jgi:hypothetical protein
LLVSAGVVNLKPGCTRSFEITFGMNHLQKFIKGLASILQMNDMVRPVFQEEFDI